MSAFQREMVAPRLNTGIEQSHNLTADQIDGRQVGPFATVTEQTGQRQVFGYRRATVFASDEVIHFVGER